MKDIIFTTLLYLLYPPLKGFSHSLDSHIRVESSPLPSAPPRGISSKAFEMVTYKWVLHIKIGEIVGIFEI